MQIFLSAGQAKQRSSWLSKETVVNGGQISVLAEMENNAAFKIGTKQEWFIKLASLQVNGRGLVQGLRQEAAIRSWAG